MTAVDYSEGMLEQARKNFEEAGVSVITFRGNAQKLPFASGRFDYIVSRNLVWNLEQPKYAYREWVRLLKPGGKLLVTDGNHYLYYYDETYLEAKKVNVIGSHHKMDGVDPTPINEIARDLPLSKEHRPEWDVNTLIALGLKHIDVKISRKQFAETEKGETKSVVTDFVVIAAKSYEGDILSDEQHQRLIDGQWAEASDNYNRIIHDELKSFRAPAWTKRILENSTGLLG